MLLAYMGINVIAVHSAMLMKRRDKETCICRQLKKNWVG